MKVLIGLLNMALSLLLFGLVAILTLYRGFLWQGNLPLVLAVLFYLTLGIISGLLLLFKGRVLIDRTFIILSSIHITLFFLPLVLLIAGVLLFGGNWDL